MRLVKSEETSCSRPACVSSFPLSWRAISETSCFMLVLICTANSLIIIFKESCCFDMKPDKANSIWFGCATIPNSFRSDPVRHDAFQFV